MYFKRFSSRLAISIVSLLDSLSTGALVGEGTVGLVTTSGMSEEREGKTEDEFPEVRGWSP